MRESEAGFTLIELAVVVAIVAIMVAASIWLFGLHPGALRASVDGFDQRYAEARSLAATSGNGATIVFAPRTTGPGFLMSVYSGRPTAANAVAKTNTMQLISDADISEATLGSPPFAIFLSSSGNASGSAHYPSIDTQGNMTFPAIAKQPSCPGAGGFTLTFTTVTPVTLSLSKGATDSRKLSCAGVMAFGTAEPQPTMTPEQLRIDAPSMLAHWTTDVGPLHFKVGEFGYTHWFASTDASMGCSNPTSDHGGAPANFDAGYPYANASAAEMALAPVPPANTPFTWAVQETGHPPDQPPGAFSLSPVAGNGGTCTARIVDDHGQEVDAAIQVMGDLTPTNLGAAPYSITLKTTDPPQSVNVAKTFDTEQLLLQFGGKCVNIVSVATTGSAPSGSPAAASFTVTPVAAGSCVLQVTDQYGEPHVMININVKAPLSPMATWPNGVEYGANGSSLRPGASCPAIAYNDPGMTQVDANDGTFASLGATTDSRGCYSGSVVAYEPGGNPETFTSPGMTCGGSLTSGFWTSQPATASALPIVATGTTVPSCNVTLQDGNNSGQSTAGHGLVLASVVGCSAAGGFVPVGQSCSFTTPTTWDVCAAANVPLTHDNWYSDDFASWNGSIATPEHSPGTFAPGDPTGGNDYSETGALGTLASHTTDAFGNPGSASTTITFTRSAPGPATFYVYYDKVYGSTHPFIGDVVCTMGFDLSGPTVVTVN